MLWNPERALLLFEEQKRVSEILYERLGLSQNNEHVLDYIRYCGDAEEYVENEEVVSHYITYHSPQEWTYIDLVDLTDTLKIIQEAYGYTSDDSLVLEYVRFRTDIQTHVPLHQVTEHFSMFCLVQEWNDWTMTTRK